MKNEAWLLMEEYKWNQFAEAYSFYETYHSKIL